jgi:signal transduction histidine kinase
VSPRAAPPLPWRTLLAIAVRGVAAALAVLLAGWGARTVALGASEVAMRARAEAATRAAFDAMGRELRELGAALADPPAIRAALDGDTRAARRLLTVAADVVDRDTSATEAAITVYSTEGEPVAWAGRPSELPDIRVLEAESWFLSGAGLAPRLVYVRPVVGDGMRIGAVVVERPLASPADLARAGGLQGGEDVVRFPTWIATVSIRLPGVNGPAPDPATAFDVFAPSGDWLLSATVTDADLGATRDRWTGWIQALALATLTITTLLLVGPLGDWRKRAPAVGPYARAVLAMGGAIVLARVLIRAATAGAWPPTLFGDEIYGSPLLRPLLTSPVDFLLTAAAGWALILVLLAAGEAWRLHGGRHRPGGRLGAFVAAHLAAGAGAAAVLLAYRTLVSDTIAQTNLDLLDFSLQPSSAPLLALQFGLTLAHGAALGLAVVVLRGALLVGPVARSDWRRWLLAAVCWVLPLAAWPLWRGTGDDAGVPLVTAVVAMTALAIAMSGLLRRYRHGSQAFRLSLLALPLVVPQLAFYPLVDQLARDAKQTFVELQYAPEVRNHRDTVYQRLQQSLGQIDAIPALAPLAISGGVAGDTAATGRAFDVWRVTDLASYPITSSVELYGPDNVLVSRFAFNLPEDLSAAAESGEDQCSWNIGAEVNPFFAAERRMLHAGKAFCDADGARTGSIVVHAMADDYENLRFISSQSPYVELLLPGDPLRREGLSGRDVEFAVYGWSRTPLYPASATAWPLPDEVFARVEQSRTPVWARLSRGGAAYDVYLLNDRYGLYALGFPVTSPLGHLVNLAGLTVLALVVFVLLLVANALFVRLGRRQITAQALLREVRASFYRKLFLAFVAAAFVPVVALVLVTRTYVANQMETGIEEEAVRTAAAAGRVVEDLAAFRAAEFGLGVDDNLMVWVSRLIDQDVNLFAGPRLLATSERNLFASGLLPTRLDADVYHALALRREAATVAREQIGEFEYLVAATPLGFDRPGYLTVPLASRQREIDAQLDTLDRRALLAVLLFMFTGAGLGYSMAERISDPVNRLTRATRRIARGELDARIAATSSDELRRLVEAFNSMASDLQRQRAELERTHRLEAWAEMARQVAHEIKNPLTPIQLNAEHLRRVHADRGEPLGPMLQECVNTILSQVKLLRQIASEFSSFASSPSARPTEVEVAGLVREVVEPYRAGLEGRIRLEVELAEPLPPVLVDRVLITRSLTNVVENALHAMPGSGTLRVTARADASVVVVRVADTGAGMDEEALARAFEPYFSTKTTGTGLGLPIAKRNVELCGGSLAVTSERDRGTTVEFRLPVVVT